MHLLDTDTCIYVLKHRSGVPQHKFRVTRNLAISAVTYAELCFGIEHGSASLMKQRWEQLNAFTRLLLILPVDEMVAKAYGSLRALLAKRGQPIGNNDLFIAAHACSLGAVLVTNNLREFKRVPDLSIENWLQ
jgi:tRNA(fMet)-specific endonuclease VapC